MGRYLTQSEIKKINKVHAEMLECVECETDVDVHNEGINNIGWQLTPPDLSLYIVEILSLVGIETDLTEK